ncbi:MAG: PilZ domain-containing protein [Candidatus Omnitrophica bacterium]|nr:PilZ domain-containing protein [Candidatus Omnitrophota bacterium]
MLLLVVELLTAVILIMILSTVIIDERKRSEAEIKPVKVKGYWDGKNRRSADRLNVALGVKYAINGKMHNARSVDISTTGIRLVLHEKFEKGMPIRMEIKIPEHKHHIKAHGEIIWSNEASGEDSVPSKRSFNTGIKFYKIQPGDEEKLFAYISKQL